VTMNRLGVVVHGNRQEFDPDRAVSVGRDPASDVVLADPSVSRSHLSLRSEDGRWLLEDHSSAGTFHDGEAVKTLRVDSAVVVNLGSPNGPAVVLEPLSAGTPPQGTPVGGVETLPAPGAAGQAGAPVGVDVGGPAPAVAPPPWQAVGAPGAKEPPPWGQGPGALPPPGAAPSRAGWGRKRMGGSVGGALVVAALLYLVAAGAGHFWPFSARSVAPKPPPTTSSNSGGGGGSGSGSGGSGGGGSQVPSSLTRLLPKDVTGCAPIPTNQVPAGFQGLTVSAACTPTALSGGSILAFQFDNQNDEQASFTANNTDVSFNPSTAGQGCPPSGSSGNGVGMWSNKLYPSNPSQTLECYQAQGSGGSGPFPVYVWSIPTKSTFVIAAAGANSSASDLNTWWVSNGGPFNS
jgi:hypothetical protein